MLIKKFHHMVFQELNTKEHLWLLNQMVYNVN